MNEPYRVPFRNRIGRPLLKLGIGGLLRLMSPITITGRENVPLGQPYIAAMNHISIYDPPFAVVFWPEWLEIMGAADVWAKPGQGQIARIYGAIPVHRGEYDRDVLERVIHVLRSGYPLLIAPEGGRSHVVAMRRAKPGIAYIVEQTGVPVVPMGLVGTTDDYWQLGSRGKRPRLEMRIGKPVHLPPVEGKGAGRRESRQRNADLVMRHIAGLLPEDYRGAYADSPIFPGAQTGH